MASGSVLLNHQDGVSKEILLDFDEAESNVFVEAFGKGIGNIL